MVEYSPELVKRICDYLSEGVTLEDIGRMDDMPSAATIHDWKSPNEKRRPKTVSEEVALDIARARELGYDVIASRLRQTARGNGDSTHDVQRDKLIIETDLKLLAKWTKKYSDKSSVEVGGIDGAPIQSNVTVTFVSATKKVDEDES